MSSTGSDITQTVPGDQNIFTGTGDVVVITQPSPVPSGEAKTRKDLGILLQRVKNYWIDGVLENSIHRAIMLELVQQIKPEAVDHPWGMLLHTPDQRNQIIPQGTKIIDTFDQSNQTLLILGEPGSGKTITLLELARDLIARFEKDETFSQTIPVVFHLSTWGETKRPLIEWLLDELASKYWVPHRFGLPWFEQNRICPLLDGLDELEQRNRGECVEAINAFGEQYGLSGLAVCCRNKEYTELDVRLKLNRAVGLLPLTSEQVDKYLESFDQKLESLRVILREDQVLQSMVRTPLMLNIMCLAYEDKPDNAKVDLVKGTFEERKRRLFNMYTERTLLRGN